MRQSVDVFLYDNFCSRKNNSSGRQVTNWRALPVNRSDWLILGLSGQTQFHCTCFLYVGKYYICSQHLTTWFYAGPGIGTAIATCEMFCILIKFKFYLIICITVGRTSDHDLFRGNGMNFVLLVGCMKSQWLCLLVIEDLIQVGCSSLPGLILYSESQL